MKIFHLLAVLCSFMILACSDGTDGKNGVDGADGVDGKDGADGTSCVMEALSDSTGFKVLCDGDSVGVVLNGAKGEKGDTGAKGDSGKDGAKGSTGQKGENGDDGEDGTSCITSPIENGYKILCDGDSVGVLTNGEKGETGGKGDGCTLEDVTDEFGRTGVKITCGEDEKTIWSGVDGAAGNDVYMCGTQKYSIETHFCYGVTLYELCNGSVYEPNQYKCENGALVAK